MPNDIGFNRNKFWLNYTVAGVKSPDYMLYQVYPSQPGSSALNTDKTPFLLPEHVEDFGGELYVHNSYPHDVWWSCGFDILDGENGTHIPTTNQTVRTKGGPTPPVAAGQEGGMGYGAIIKGDKYSYKAEDLPLGVPVFMHITVSAYDAPDLKHALPDDYPLNNEIGAWLKRVDG